MNDQGNEEAKRGLRTEISDISAAGPELNEEELRLITGGARPKTPATEFCGDNDWCDPDQ